ncbi:Multidrug and toxin extrusion protein 1 [Durusdinium trenchii]|uniref:Multidrug and toxin extrusion protein 1 n=1 Tax=Durusdinium trenchii TaxID=1381693 RepID=A0ABP0QWU2_9DINO
MERAWKLPVIHELRTAASSIGDFVGGKPESAKKKWEDYGNGSVLGSPFKAAFFAVKGELEEAERLGRERLHEIGMCGKSLRLVAEDNPQAANEVWTSDYVADSVLGSLVMAAVEAVKGQNNDAMENLRRSMRAWEKAELAVDNALDALERLATLCDSLNLFPPLVLGSLLTVGLVRQLKQLPRFNSEAPSPEIPEIPRAAARRRSVSVSVIGTIASEVGPDDLAVFNASYRICWMALTFLGALAGGVGVQLNIALGKGSTADAKHAAWVGTMMAIVVLVVLGVLILCIPRSLARIFSNDPKVLDLFESCRWPFAAFAVLMNLSVNIEKIPMAAGRVNSVFYAGLAGSWLGQVPGVILCISLWRKDWTSSKALFFA